MSNVSDLGEFGLIERLTGVIGKPKSDDLIVSIGDDAAVWRVGQEFVIATTDTMVEGVHFEIGRAPWADIGWKALATNVSDINAMGGTPLFALITLAIPPTMATDDVELIYAGLAECACEYGVTIVGGDTVRAPQIAVTVSLVGRAERRNDEPLLLRRNGARVRDIIAVTGTLGDSAGGLRRLKKDGPSGDPLVRRHLWPHPPHIGRTAAGTGITCAIDVSDGLLQDIGHICERSKVGAVLNAKDVPISNELREAFPDDALELACTGGEDYEVVLVGDKDVLDTVASTIGLVQLSVIGEIVRDESYRVRLLDDAGSAIMFARPGWDAFR